ncbi:MAG: Mov34/MPN/PAD-1 family protein [Thermoplasmata archaeon]|nr:Mov34/MPN/PAD-1 family protein [Thermoplasmata archaeon]
MPLFAPPRKTRGMFRGVARELLEAIFENARNAHPNEFAALLRLGRTGLINQYVVLPGTISSNEAAVFMLHMKPADFSIIGTIHSHPSPYAVPSDADLDLFQRFGWVHIIVAYPYNMRTWKAYNGRGEEIRIEVVEKQKPGKERTSNPKF